VPLFLPYRRAGLEEKVVQSVLFPVTFLLGLLAMWPLLMMLVLSFGDPYDWWQGRRWPDLGHLTSPKRFYAMYLCRRYDYWPSLKGFNIFYRSRVTDADTIIKYDEDIRLEGNWKARAKDGLACLKESMPWTHYEPLYDSWEYFKDSLPYTGYTGIAAGAWKKFLKKRYGNVRDMNRKFQTDYPTFGHVRVPDTVLVDRRSDYPFTDPWQNEYQEFLNGTLRQEWKLIRPEARWYRAFLSDLPEVKGGVDRLNALVGMTCSTWDDLVMSDSFPANPREQPYWGQFVRENLTAFYLEIAPDAMTNESYRKFLASKYGSPKKAAEVYGVASVAALELSPTVFGALQSATSYRDWDGFVRTLPVEKLRVRGPLRIWRAYLEAKKGTIDALNRDYGTQYASFAEVPWPQVEIDRLDWEGNRIFYIMEEVFKNYRRAWSFITDITPTLKNTARFAILFCLLAVITNTAAGYVLSRYARGPATMFIVFFLALAAFPIEAIAVPNFILLRKLGLLNTVWALVLPMAINGYYIYLMKSAFDSIPRDYFEEAMLDGAGHWAILRTIGLPFVRPMIAVIAVYAFIWSYSNFMWALIVSQKTSEQTLPLFIFGLSREDVAPCLLGALMVVTTFPPLLVFILANRTMQRSMLLPRA